MMKPTAFLLFLLIPFMGMAQAPADAPLGTLQVTTDLYIDQSPVTNAMYREYQDYFRASSRDAGAPTRLSESTIDGAVDFTTYSTHPRYDKLPVLWRSLKDARDYCNWRTVMYKLRSNLSNRDLRNHQKLYKKIVYRLPTYDELILASMTYYRKKRIRETREKSPLALEGKEFSLSDLRFHNISEMTSDGRLFGSNWKKEFRQNPPTEYIGFRCICEVQK